MDLLNVTVYGDPVPKGRPRAGPRGVYTPQRTILAEDALRAAAQRAYGTGPPTAGPVGIEVRFYLPTRRPIDGDNLLKLVADALQRGRRPAGGVILDDAQIEEWHCRLFRRIPAERPRTEIRVYALTDVVAPCPAGGEGRAPRVRARPSQWRRSG